MNRKLVGGLFFLIVITLILGVKAVQMGWFIPKPPLVLNNQPAILFFNNDRGCECQLAIFNNADAQLSVWPEEKHRGIPIFAINLERRPDLAKKFLVYRAPTLILLDSEGQDIWRQDESASDDYPLDLAALETLIDKLNAQK